MTDALIAETRAKLTEFLALSPRRCRLVVGTAARYRLLADAPAGYTGPVACDGWDVVEGPPEHEPGLMRWEDGFGVRVEWYAVGESPEERRARERAAETDRARREGERAAAIRRNTCGVCGQRLATFVLPGGGWCGCWEEAG